MPSQHLFVETHAHLDDRQFDEDRPEVIRRAQVAGVIQIITVGADLSSSQAAVRLAQQHQSLYATVGIHPHAAESVSPGALEALRDLAVSPGVVAIGEIGLDFYRDHAPRDLQVAAFDRQLGLAAAMNMPVVVHIRDRRGQADAYEAALDALQQWVGRRRETPGASLGVLHCYSGDLDTAQEAMKLGFCLGIDGPVTYPNAQMLRSLVAQLPLDCLLLETDCPYLAPQIRRGRRNEPSYIQYIAAQVAELQGMPVHEVARVTTANARHLFGLPEG